MSQPLPPNWQPPPGSQNPFADQPSGPPVNPYGPRPSADLADDPAMRWVLPVGQSAWSIAAGYLGLISLGACFLGPFAILCGIIAIRELRGNPRLSGWGRAIVGLVLGSLGTLGFILMIITIASQS